VTTFIKTEEQNYSLYNYVNMLNSEIDTIDEQNRKISEAIHRHESLSVLSLREKDAMKKQIKAEIEQTRKQAAAKEAHIA
jgi:hypothetical protein